MDRREIENKLYDLDYENEDIVFFDLMYLIVSYKKKIFYTMIVTLVIGLLIAFTRPTYYQAKALMMTRSLTQDNRNKLANDDVIKNQNLIKSLEVIATDPELIKKVMDNIGINEEVEEELENLEVKAEVETLLLTITYKSSNPTEAMEFLNSLTEELSNKVSVLLPSQALENVSPISTPEKSMPKREGLIIGISIVVGFLLGILLAFLDMVMKRKILTLKEFRKNSQMEILTTLQDLTEKGVSGVDADENLKGQFEKAMALLKINTGVKMDASKKGIYILVTSTLKKEGKSLFTETFATYMGKLGYKVLVSKSYYKEDGTIDDWENEVTDIEENSKNEFIDNLEVKDESKEMLKRIIKKVEEDKARNVDVAYMSKLNYLDKGLEKELEFVTNQLKEVYNLIIVEVPALSVALEPFFLRKTLVDFIIYVSGYGMVTPKDLKFYTKLVRNQDTEVLGMVVNKVDKLAYKYQDFNNGDVNKNDDTK